MPSSCGEHARVASRANFNTIHWPLTIVDASTKLCANRDLSLPILSCHTFPNGYYFNDSVMSFHDSKRQCHLCPTGVNKRAHNAATFPLSNSLFSLTLAFFPLLCLFASQVSASCPMNYLINPCRCLDSRITCDGEYSYSLKSVFDKLNRSVQLEEDRIFDEFTLNNTGTRK